MFNRRTRRFFGSRTKISGKTGRKLNRAIASALIESLETRRLMTATWTALTNQAPSGIHAMTLLSNGDVIAQFGESTQWAILTPSSTGSYINGTWSMLSNMHDTRIFYSSQLLTNGNLFVAGGEYGSGDANAEVYNTLTNTWTETPPSGGGDFEDSISEILANGSVMIPPVYPTISGETVIYNPTTNTWSQGPTLYRGSDADEQTWIKLADGSILTSDGSGGSSTSATSERYIPATNTWVNDGTIPVKMWDGEGEIGAGGLLPNGKAFLIGSTGNTAIYTPSGYNSSDGIYTPNGSTAGTWTAGPTIPGGLGEDDAPAAVLPDGTILLTGGPADSYSGPTSFFIYNASANTITALSANGDPGDTGGPDGSRFLDLPDGTLLLSTGSSQLWDFNPGTTPLTAPDPTVTGIVHNADGSYTLSGTQLNGNSEGAIYGDDAQMNSNYPIVRLTSSGGTVYFARTYNWSSTGVDTGATPETTKFTLPLGLPAGTYTLNVMVNGFVSANTTLTTPAVTDTAPTITATAAVSPSPVTGTTATFSVGATGSSALTYTWVTTSTPSGESSPSFSTNGTTSSNNITATFQQAGTYSFSVTATDVNGLSATSSVTVTVNQTLTSIVVSPGTPNLTAGQTQQLTAIAYDQFGNALSSQPGFTWTQVSGNGTTSTSGLYTSPSSGTLAIVNASSGGVTGTDDVYVVSSPWVSTDLNTPPVAGGGFDSSGTFNISGSGTTTGSTTDQGHLVYRTLGGDGTIIADITGQSASTSSAEQAGVMIRTTTDANSEEVFVGISPGSGAVMYYRSGIGGAESTKSVSGVTAPEWVKLVRKGNAFSGYYSANGSSWTLIETVNVLMPESSLMGMFVVGGANSSNGTTVNSTATFANLSLIDPAVYSISVSAGSSASVNLLSNDVGPSGSTLSIASVTQGGKGTVTLNASGGATYTAGLAASGSDSFTYTMSDGLGDTATGIVTVNILGLQAYYKFSEGTGSTTADATGNGNTATITGAAWTTSGVAGDGLTFNGSGNYVSVPALNLSTNTVTFSGWIYSNGTQIGATGLIFNRDGSNGNGLDYYDGTHLGYTWGTNAGTYNFNSHLTVPTGKWTFVALVVTASNATIYMYPTGGSLSSAVSSIANPTEPFSSPILIGEDSNSTTRCFNGTMDEIRIYNTALSSSAISALTSSSSFLTAVPVTVNASAGTPSLINPLTTDGGPNGSTLSITSFTQPHDGAVAYNASTGFTYTTSDLNTNTDSFTYTLSDGLGDTTTGVVYVNILGNIAYYKFDEGSGGSTNDITGDGYTGTLNYNTWTTGLTGLSSDDGLGFNGVNSIVTFNTSPSLSGTTNFTVGGWIKTTSTQPGVIVQQRDANGFNGEYGLTVNGNGTVSFYIYYNGYQVNLTTTTTVNNGVWHQITAIRNGSVGSIYIDGVQAATGSGTIASLSATIGVDLGADFRNGDDYFNGTMDDIFISDVALSTSALATVSKLGPVVSTAAAASPGSVNGSTTALTVAGSDYYESSIPLNYNWVATTLPNGATAPTFTTNNNSSATSTTATFYKAGNYVFTVTISDQSNLTTTSTVSVVVNQTLTSVLLSSTTVVTGGTSQATAYDQFGNAVATSPTWNATGGSINGTGLFTAANTGGAFQVTATSNGTNASAGVTVVPNSYSGTAGNDTYAIRLSPTDPTQEQIFVNTPETGTPTYTVPISQLSLLTFTPASDGSLTIDFANGNPLPGSGINYSGGSKLLLLGATAGGLGFTINGSQIVDTAAGSSPIRYSSLQNIAFNLSGGSNTVTQLAQPGASVAYNEGTLSNTLNISGGSYTFSSDPQTSGGSLTVYDNSSVTFNGTTGAAYTAYNLQSLKLGTSGVAIVSYSNSSTGRAVLVTSGLTIAAGGTLDLTNNSAIIHGGDMVAISALAARGFNIAGGYWNGTGITSSTAAADATFLTTLGIVSNNLSGSALYTSFDNQNVNLNDVLIKYTYWGDANLSGTVDGSDYSRIDSGHLTGSTGWVNGDFNYDGVINGSDYTLIDNAFNTQRAALAAMIADEVGSSPAHLAAGVIKPPGHAKKQSPAFAGNVFNTTTAITFPGSGQQSVESSMQKKDLLDQLTT